jgi:hypothetical protein
MLLPGWTMVHLIKHDSRGFWEGVFWMRLMLYIGGSWGKQMKSWLPPRKGELHSRHLQTAVELSWSLLVDFGLPRIHTQVGGISSLQRQGWWQNIETLHTQSGHPDRILLYRGRMLGLLATEAVSWRMVKGRRKKDPQHRTRTSLTGLTLQNRGMDLSWGPLLVAQSTQRP